MIGLRIADQHDGNMGAEHGCATSTGPHSSFRPSVTTRLLLTAFYSVTPANCLISSPMRPRVSAAASSALLDASGKRRPFPLNAPS